MGCGSGCISCGINKGIPAGCKGNGGCGTGGCNRLNSYNWLMDIPAPAMGEPFPIVEVSLKNGAEKVFARNAQKLPVVTGEMVAVSSEFGYDLGRITLSGELVKLQMRKKAVGEASDQVVEVLRKADSRDIERYEDSISLEKKTMVRARAIAKQLGLQMKIGDVQYQANGKKATFFYTADGRVDFRELIKIYASEFKVKIKMHQIGSRQEAGRIGGIGDCGRELCCSTWLTSFKSVSTTAARYQNLSINHAKLSGQCGRLKCCLNYELDTYLDALKEFPENADRIETELKEAFLQKTDIFRKLMWYAYKDESTFYPLTVTAVKDILKMNSEGKQAPPLGEVQFRQITEELPVEENLVGQVSLKSLERKEKKRKKQGRRRRPGRR